MMALYAVCATDARHTMRPCALVQAAGRREAAAAGARLRAAGRLGFLEAGAVLRARLASRREAALWREALAQPVAAPRAPNDASWRRRAERLEDALFQRLWREGVGP
jgi:hypothetical protein